MRTAFLFLAGFLPLLYGPQARSQPVRIGVAGLSHGHVHWILGSAERGDVEITGIYETDQALIDRLAEQYGFIRGIVYSDLGAMLDAVRPEAVVAFGSIYDHLSVVQAAAPRGVHVMVEKPLAVSLEHAREMEALAKTHGIHLLTNYETTWYASTHETFDLVEEGAVGPLRKIVVRDGHQGPQEIGVEAEFLTWLTDPVLNGAGALMDFGCYGANLVTRLMGGAAPTTVTAVTQQLKPELYPRVDDEATIILTYPETQAIIQASWNWPVNRKDMQVYGRTGYVYALDGNNMRVRLGQGEPEEAVLLEPRRAPFDDPFAFLAAVVRGEVVVEDSDLSSLANNMTVMRILDAAKRSAQSGETVTLAR